MPKPGSYRQACLVEALTSGTRMSLRRACIWGGYSRGRQESWSGLLQDRGIVELFRIAIAEGKALPPAGADRIIEAVAKLDAEELE
jgi:hypothetical protein